MSYLDKLKPIQAPAPQSGAIASYKQKLKPLETRETRMEQGLPVSSERRFQKTGSIEPSAGGQFVRDIAKPVVRTGATIGKVVQGVRDLGKTLRGEQTDQNAINQPVQSRYFGNIDPLGTRAGQRLSPKEELKDVIGTGLELSSFIPVGTGAKLATEVAKQPFKQALKTTGKAFAREGAIQGGLGSAGRSIQEGDTFGQTLGKTALGAGIGAGAGFGLGVGGTAIARTLKPKPQSLIDAEIDKNIRKALSGTTGDLETIETSAVRAKNALERLVTDKNIEIPDTSKPIGSGAKKAFEIGKANPNEWISAIKNQEQKIAQIGRSSAEEASRMGRMIDTLEAQKIVADAVNTGKLPRATGERFMRQIQSLRNDPLNVHEWVQDVNKNWKQDMTKSPMTKQIAEDIAKTFRRELDTNVYRGEYGQAYGDNQELKRLLISVAKKANKKVDFGDISSDAGLDAAISLLTSNPLYMGRTLADSVFKGLVRNMRNRAGFKAIQKAAKLSKGGAKMPTQGLRPQLALPPRSSALNVQMKGGRSIPLGKLQSQADLRSSQIGEADALKRNIQNQMQANRTLALPPASGGATGTPIRLPKRGNVPLGLGDEPQARVIRRVTSDAKQFSETLMGEADAFDKNAMEQVFTEMMLSEAGKRIIRDYGDISISPSTFPKWISDDLRSMELFNRVINKLENGSTRFGVREQRLIQEMKKRAEFYKKEAQKVNKLTPEQEEFKRMVGGDQAFGAIAGIERDEEGNIKFNPEKAALGLGVIGSIKSKAGQKALDKVGDIVKKKVDDLTTSIQKAKASGQSLVEEAKKYKTAEDFANKAPSDVIDKLRADGVRGAEQRMAFWEKATKGMDKTPVIDNLNPTGGLLVDYTPEARMTAKLGKNITTLDKTMGKSADETITIYRGAPKNQKQINPGDFVTTDRELARSYTGDNNVLELKVKLSDVLDDVTEPLGGEYLYRPKTNNLTSSIKSAKQSGQSFDEWVKGQKQAEYSPLTTQQVDRSIKLLNESGVPVKSGDDILTLYHGTNAKGVKGITESGTLNEFSYLATDKNASIGFVFGKGGDVLEIKVPVKDAGFVQQSMAGSKGATIQNPVKLVKGKDGIWRAEQWQTRSQLKAEWDKVGNSIKKPSNKAGFITPKITIAGAGATVTGGLLAKIQQRRENKKLEKTPQPLKQQEPKKINPVLQNTQPLQGEFIGTNYDPYDPDQTRPNANGEGAVTGVTIDETMVAVPRKPNSNEAMVRLGTVIYVPELDDIFLVADLMNKRFDGQNKIDFARPEKGKTPDPTVNKNFQNIQIIRQGNGYEDTRNFVQSGEWEKMKQEFNKNK